MHVTQYTESKRNKSHTTPHPNITSLQTISSCYLQTRIHQLTIRHDVCLMYSAGVQACKKIISFRRYVKAFVVSLDGCVLMLFDLVHQ